MNTLKKILFVVNDSLDKDELQLSIFENMVDDFNDRVSNNSFPHKLVLKSNLDDDPIVLETLEKQNLVIDYLYNWFYMEGDKDYCEQLSHIKNMVNLVN